MARRYDHRTTTFSPEGRLYQVEYAMEAINHAGSCIGILGKDGIVLACEKKISSKMLDSEKIAEKMYRIDNHIAVAVAGITSDANILIDLARLSSQRFLFAYDEPIPVENLVRSICDRKQGYTQYGGQRPFGVSFVYAGWDEHFGFQIYYSDPSGNFQAWKGIAIGSNHQASQSILKTEWKEGLTVKDSLKLAVKVMSKTMDSTSLTHEKLEFSSLTLVNGKVKYHVLTKKEVTTLLKVCEDEKKEEEKKEKKK